MEAELCDGHRGMVEKLEKTWRTIYGIALISQSIEIRMREAIRKSGFAHNEGFVPVV